MLHKCLEMDPNEMSTTDMILFILTIAFGMPIVVAELMANVLGLPEQRQ